MRMKQRSHPIKVFHKEVQRKQLDVRTTATNQPSRDSSSMSLVYMFGTNSSGISNDKDSPLSKLISMKKKPMKLNQMIIHEIAIVLCYGAIPNLTKATTGNMSE